MVERELLLAAPPGTARLFITRPEQADKAYPLCVLLMDAPGYRPELQRMARRLATAGFAVAVPDLYHRTLNAGSLPDPQALAEDDPRRREVIYRHMNAVTLASATEDLHRLLAAVADDVQIDQSRIGVFGYCMSGPLALGLSSRFPTQIAAAASIHGVRLFHQGAASAHRWIPGSSAELYLACAEADDWAPRALIGHLEAWLAAAGRRYRLDWYPGTQHGFVFPQRAGIFDELAAERHWAALVDLFDRRLKWPSAG